MREDEAELGYVFERLEFHMRRDSELNIMRQFETAFRRKPALLDNNLVEQWAADLIMKDNG